MVDLAMLQVVRDLVAIFGVIAGFTYYVLIVRNSQRTQHLQLETRQAQLFMTVYNNFTSTRFHPQGNAIRFQWELSDFDNFIEKYGPEKNLEAWADLLSVVTVFEGVGLLVKKKLVDVNMVGELMSGLITRTWERIEPIIIEYRERFNWPQALRSFETLYNEMKKREQLAKTSI